MTEILDPELSPAASQLPSKGLTPKRGQRKHETEINTDEVYLRFKRGDSISTPELQALTYRFQVLVTAMSGLPDYGAVCASAIHDLNRVRGYLSARVNPSL